MKTARVDEQIEAFVEAGPQLTDDQRARLVELLQVPDVVPQRVDAGLQVGGTVPAA